MFPDHLSPEHLAVHQHVVRELGQAQAQATRIMDSAHGAVQSWLRYLAPLYQLGPTDQVTAEGQILRSERAPATEQQAESVAALNGDVP